MFIPIDYGTGIVMLNERLKRGEKAKKYCRNLSCLSYCIPILFSYGAIPKIKTGMSISDTPSSSKSQTNCSKHEIPDNILLSHSQIVIHFRVSPFLSYQAEGTKSGAFTIVTLSPDGRMTNKPFFSAYRSMPSLISIPATAPKT